ncbi:glycosyltransferase family 4 protein [Rhodobium gokarnense]|uniref:Glycosyltransferase involved in cell wall biosynthesis n=1 Tax=Rhodobium gokarnense TaxID=364296 RepID=A0ABT3HIK8_9HYPH|nr:glycosyltransferase family 1 protein [Rhodobium gokarnense]MCW2310251.1 glycosyltransferase involved in cell wall biosynthesis [Rhodobium gokarnense]
MTHILIVTDAWRPQINGVVKTLERIGEELTHIGIKVTYLTPERFRTLPCPTYPEIRLSMAMARHVGHAIEEIGPDYIHVATEGPLGLGVRGYLKKTGRGGYTTSYHTRFPEYLSARFPVPERWAYAWLRKFHNDGLGCMVTTPSLKQALEAQGFEKLMYWTRGVDHGLFRPDAPKVFQDLPRPIFINVGRVAVEKNIEAFLALDLPGTKVVVGDGPSRPALEAKFPEAVFTGAKVGEELASHFASADVFVFPSLTDTFGNVIVESLASGVPVAAFPVTGPLDIIGETGAGVLSEDLREAALQALDIPRERCLEVGRGYNWPASARQFLHNILEANGAARRNAAE